MKILQKALALFLSFLVLWIPDVPVYALPADQSAAQTAPPLVEKQTPEELQQLVAPIALYPDALVSQIFAGATYPTEIVEADRWMQAHPNLKGKDLPALSTSNLGIPVSRLSPNSLPFWPTWTRTFLGHLRWARPT
jgi:hypothetical protein